MVNNKIYKLYTDGACSGNPGRIGIGCVIYDEKNDIVYTISKELRKGTNNEAEYLAIINGLKAVIQFIPETVLVYSDSQLAINQINGDWMVKKFHLLILFKQVIEIVNKNKNINFCFKWTSRKFNKIADHLASSAINQSQGVFINGEFIEWTEVADIGSIEEISKLPKVNDICLNAIKRANELNDDFRFRDFISLKVGNKDEYNTFSEDELFSIIGVRFGKDVVNWLKKALKTTDKTFREDAIKWAARGLYPNLALKKASVNRELEDRKGDDMF